MWNWMAAWTNVVLSALDSMWVLRRLNPGLQDCSRPDRFVLIDSLSLKSGFALGNNNILSMQCAVWFHSPDYLCWHHGPWRSQEEECRWQSAWFLLLNGCKLQHLFIVLWGILMKKLSHIFFGLLLLFYKRISVTL